MMMIGNGVVGILREAKSKWERRAPLSPAHCAKLIRRGVVSRIVVQPCNKRIYRDSEFQDAGCEISDNLSKCGLVLGVKQPKIDSLMEDRAYGFFSHTHKGQSESMPLLDQVLNKRITLYDYELIVDDNNKRLVAFGTYAGRAGMIDFFRGLGERLLSLGYSTPFVSLGSSYMYLSLSAAKAAVLMIGEAIARRGLPEDICPLVFAFTGTGNVSQGAQEIFRLLPHEYVDPSRLKDLSKEKLSNKKVYGCVVTAEHMVAPNDPSKPFKKSDYYVHPENYHSVFSKDIAPYTSVIMNCMYWEPRFPRLLTKDELHELFEPENGCRLLGVADISCDIEGSIECLDRTTNIEQPFFRYNPVARSYHTDIDGDGILILAVDILPTEFAKEATQHFGNGLSPFIQAMATSRQPEVDAPSPLRKACIAHAGHLSPLFEYIDRIRDTQSESPNGKEKFKTKVSLSGHLFDKFLINEALDVIEAAGGNFHITSCQLGQTSDAESHAELEVEANSKEALASIVDRLSLVASSNTTPKRRVPQNMSSSRDDDFKVLLLGAGRMCEPAVLYLAKQTFVDKSNSQTKRVFVQVGSLFLGDARRATEGIPNAAAVKVDVSNYAELKSFVGKVDVVISLLPASFHEQVAVVCIELKKHLVTASYVSHGMAALHAKAQEAGVTLLCEMGLDPGIDHMIAMKMISSAHSKGGKVISYASYCGGLPAPEAADDNPLRYKFSWNPAGALKAGRNPAVYKLNNEIIHVPGEYLLASARPFEFDFNHGLSLEVLPNRDSLKYGDIYGISNEATTVYRGTLRYEGFSLIMDTLGKLGFYDTEAVVLLGSREKPTYHELMNYVVLCNDLKARHLEFESVLECISFLGLDSFERVPGWCNSLFDVLCLRMEEKLVLKENERDLVLLHHEVEVSLSDSEETEKHAVTLVEFGDAAQGEQKQETAMARTVGLTAAIGAQLLLTGEVKSTGVIRPIEAEVFLPALELLEKAGLKMEEKTTLNC